MLSQNTDSVYELPSSRNVVCCYVRGEYSFVGSDQYGLKCLTCKYDTLNCAHVLFVQSKLDEDDESCPFLHHAFSDLPVRRPPFVPKCTSKKIIHFDTNVQNRRVLRDNEIRTLLSCDENGIFQIMPAGYSESSHCLSCCYAWSCENTESNGCRVSRKKLFLFNETLVCDGEFTSLVFNVDLNGLEYCYNCYISEFQDNQKAASSNSLSSNVAQQLSNIYKETSRRLDPRVLVRRVISGC